MNCLIFACMAGRKVNRFGDNSRKEIRDYTDRKMIVGELFRFRARLTNLLSPCSWIRCKLLPIDRPLVLWQNRGLISGF